MDDRKMSEAGGSGDAGVRRAVVDHPEQGSINSQYRRDRSTETGLVVVLPGIGRYS